MRPQIASLEHGAHIVVGTPGRIRDHLGRQTLELSTVNTLVLDEADRMTDMGFYDEIAGIVSACPKRRQTLLFSATYPDDIRVATEAFLADPVEVTVQAQHDNSKIEHRLLQHQGALPRTGGIAARRGLHRPGAVRRTGTARAR
jgi:ATP-independent RNA helicase DbpA